MGRADECGFPARVVLEGVPKIQFFSGEKCPEDIVWPSVLKNYLEYTGDGFGCKHGHAGRFDCTYAYLVGTSGAAFYLSWKPLWEEDNVVLHFMSKDPEAPYRNALHSVGYSLGWIMKEKGRDNEASFREHIIRSIGMGNPVIAFGVVGPAEPCLIAGYDDGGDTLIGWSFFQDIPGFNSEVDFEASGYFRKADWYKDTWCLMILGAKEGTPQEEIFRSALAEGLEIAREPQGYDRVKGLAAYTLWAETIQRDEDFATDDQALLGRMYGVHDDAVGTVAEARWYGSLFLRQAAEYLPSAKEELEAAAECFVAEHDLMWKAWELVGGNGRGELQIGNFARPEVRREIVPVILEARAKDAEALEHIERALGRL